MPSFDFSSEADMVALKNAVDVVSRQIDARYDFKGTSAQIEFADGKNGLELTADSSNQIDALIDVIQSKLIRRDISPKALDLANQPRESGTQVKRSVAFKKGLDQEKAKKLTKLIRDQFPKAKAQIQGDSVRVSSTSKDDLQGIMSLLKQQDLDYPLQFQNLR